MIIRPDFLEHWKTVALCGSLQDDSAPLLLLRLWAHCQNARSDRIANGGPEKLKAICRWKGDPLQLWAAMTSHGWVHTDGTDMVATGWREINKSLFNSWQHGSMGGRPKASEPPPLSPDDENPRVSHGFPENNPRVMPDSATNDASEKPTGFPEITRGLTDKRREEKSREESKTPTAIAVAPEGGGRSRRFVPPSLAEVQAYCEERGNGVDPNAWMDHYTAKGWMVGKNRMVDWKAAVRTWEHGDGKRRTHRTDFDGIARQVGGRAGQGDETLGKPVS